MNDLARTSVRSQDIMRKSLQVAGTTKALLIAPVSRKAGAMPPVAIAPVTPISCLGTHQRTQLQKQELDQIHTLKPSASASVTFVPAVVQTFFLSASSAASAETVGRPKQLTIARVTWFVETFLLIVAPIGANEDPVLLRMSFL